MLPSFPNEFRHSCLQLLQIRYFAGTAHSNERCSDSYFLLFFFFFDDLYSYLILYFLRCRKKRLLSLAFSFLLLFSLLLLLLLHYICTTLTYSNLFGFIVWKLFVIALAIWFFILFFFKWLLVLLDFEAVMYLYVVEIVAKIKTFLIREHFTAE